MQVFLAVGDVQKVNTATSCTSFRIQAVFICSVQENQPDGKEAWAPSLREAQIDDGLVHEAAALDLSEEGQAGALPQILAGVEEIEIKVLKTQQT